MTYFNPGDVVVPKVTAQGMTKGERYKVTDVDVNSTPFGDFATYKLKPEKGGSEFWVGNLHLLASKVKMSKRAQLSKKAKHLLITRFSSDSAVRAAVREVDTAINDAVSDLSDMKRLIRELNPANEADDFSESMYNLQYALGSGLATSVNSLKQKVAKLEQVSEAYYLS